MTIHIAIINSFEKLVWKFLRARKRYRNAFREQDKRVMRYFEREIDVFLHPYRQTLPLRLLWGFEKQLNEVYRTCSSKDVQKLVETFISLLSNLKRSE